MKPNEQLHLFMTKEGDKIYVNRQGLCDLSLQ